MNKFLVVFVTLMIPLVTIAQNLPRPGDAMKERVNEIKREDQQQKSEAGGKKFYPHAESVPLKNIQPVAVTPSPYELEQERLAKLIEKTPDEQANMDRLRDILNEAEYQIFNYHFDSARRLLDLYERTELPAVKYRWRPVSEEFYMNNVLDFAGLQDYNKALKYYYDALHTLAPYLIKEKGIITAFDGTQTLATQLKYVYSLGKSFARAGIIDSGRMILGYWRTISENIKKENFGVDANTNAGSAIRLNSFYSVKCIFELGKTYLRSYYSDSLKKEDLTSAKSFFSEAKELAPENPDPFLGLGICAFIDKDYTAAETLLSKGIELDRKMEKSKNFRSAGGVRYAPVENAALFYYRAKVRLALNDNKNALSDLHTATLLKYDEKEYFSRDFDELKKL